MQIYLDNSASTPLSPAARQAMKEWLDQPAGNASSIHYAGRAIKFKIEDTRSKLAQILRCQPKEIFFSSGGTESNNLALVGTALANRERGNHLIISAMEHPSVLQSARYLEQNGFEVDYFNSIPNGEIQVSDIEELVRPQTILLSAMYVNNESGVIFPVRQMADLCKHKGILFHCDAVQVFGKYDLNLDDIPIDLLSISAHKLHGPAGIGALVIREGTPASNILFGGGQEAGRRPGTENISGIVGFGAVLDEIEDQLEALNRVRDLQETFETGLCSKIESCNVIAQKAKRSAYISQIAFPGISNDTLLMKLDLNGIAASVGSACSSGSINRSHVLVAMGLADEVIDSSLRFSFSRFNTAAEIELAVQKIIGIVQGQTKK